MRVLITGNKGLIGSHIQTYLESMSHEVVGWDLKDGRDINMLYLEHGKFDIAIHCAALCSIRECINSPADNFADNVSGTHQFFEFARSVDCKKIIYFSSSRVLSKERNTYTAAKLFGEELCKGYYDCYGINYTIIRPSTVFGENDDTDRIIPRFINNALNDKPLEIYGNIGKRLYLTYIKDFMDMFIQIFEGNYTHAIRDVNERKAFDMTCGESVNIHKLAEFIIKETKSKSKIKFKKAETAQPQQVYLEGFDRQLKYGWQAGIIKSIEYYRGKT